MAANNYDFVIRNGLQLSANLIYATGGSGMVGIATGSPSNTLTVNGTFASYGNATLLGTLSTTGNGVFSNYLYVGTGAHQRRDKFFRDQPSGG